MDVVIIHVCDENRHVTRDFNCKRDILVKNMKYFKSFLPNAENSFEDVDISVHCDVEIFEWLMQFIHEVIDPPKLDKAIVVSILISSEFLQMDSLVELCLQFIATNLNEIMYAQTYSAFFLISHCFCSKIPIDLACISEKLLNKLTVLTPPNVNQTYVLRYISLCIFILFQVLAVTKDKKDKILNKLYKRRVEIDYSRKSSSKSGETLYHFYRPTLCLI